MTRGSISADNADVTHAIVAIGVDVEEGIPTDGITAAKIAADAVGSSEIATDAVGSAEIAADAVTKAELAGAFLKAELVAGQDETGDTTIPVTGSVAGDELVGVFVQDGTSGVLTQRALADFTGPATGNITVAANAANNTGNFYLIIWLDLT
jgi:hypothetical protein